MGYRCRDLTEKAGTYNFRSIEVVLARRNWMDGDDNAVAVLTVDNHWDTLRFVQENMDEFVANIVRTKQMNAQRRMRVEESAQLFENNLEPLFSLVFATAKEHVMDKLSSSLKKALLLMAMDRYSCDSDSICRALGITKVKLEKELKSCGLLHQEMKAA